MPINRVISRTDDGPGFEKNLIEWVADMGPGESLKKLTANETITDAQRRWYKGICLPALVKADENGETEAWWDDEVKKYCKGLAYLKRQVFFVETRAGQRIEMGRLTTTGVGIKKMTLFIEEILSQAMQRGWPVSEPDPELRK